ncbi:DUF1460 domain-containing protein [Spirosoma taeanense]|uniref:DUF1460 domain-containing protein n=1 Tax=Spirosoma taeanense TaxID=2735870 RepID=A0A6M5Y4P5_9BACT|nr:N-acetylmuramoyl-L-alanine amidase-like domain-containing protein [Spirosoma taeanense]QJW89497.1 DUF1460 domain-containing protein [Spirosoma taeanense]
MIKLFTALLVVCMGSRAQAQEAAPADFRLLANAGGKTSAEMAVSIGKKFIGAPYVSHTLDTTPTEQLIVNVREFDCTTYLETVLALTLAYQEEGSQANPVSFDATFRRYLTQLRYRDGRINGYASRLHYFSDWLRNNERKGLVVDVTRDLPGSISVAKPVSYMTSFLYKYPPLRDPAIFQQIAQAEAALSQQAFAFIPKKNIREAEAQLREGDIVMLTAARPGLDMKHVGLAVRQPNGRIHLLHASSEHGQVVITPYPLSDYVLCHRHLSGIRVARLRPDGQVGPAIVRGE